MDLHFVIGASDKGHKSVVELLIEKGAKIITKEKFGITALNIASNYGHKSVVEILITSGADN